MGNNEIPEGFNMTELGPLPDGWRVMRLGDVTEKTKQKNPRKTPEWRFKYVDVSSISRDALKIAECKLCQGKDAPSRAKKLVKRNDVIFATVRPTLKRLTLIDEEFDGEICSTAFCILRATEHILNPLYLFYAVQRDVFIDEFEKVQRGASYPAITDSDVKNQSIPLPPLPEQHRIAAVLSAVQDAKETTGAVIATAKSLKKSLMRHLFTYGPVLAGAAESAVLVETEIGLVPEGWDVVRLGGHCNFTTGKLNSNQAVINGKYPFFTCSQETYRISKYSFNCEAVLLSGNNARGIYSVKYYNGKFDAYQRTYVITIKDNHYLDYHYLRDVIETKLEELRVGSIGTSTKFLTLKMLLNLEIPLPHLPTQQKIASILSTVDKKIEAEENKKKALDELFKSLLHNLMTGKVRVNHLEVIS